MKTWLQDNWRWTLVTIVAWVIMGSLLWQIVKAHGFKEEILDETGKWTIRFLLFTLLMTPLNTLFGWRSALKLRRTLGLWTFGFAALHFSHYVSNPKALWLQFPMPDYIAGLGLIGLIILTLLAVTSTRWAMKRMGKWWKRLHRLVYVVGIVGVTHGLLEIDVKIQSEGQLYVAILVILLVMRLPILRTMLVSLRHGQVHKLLSRT